MHEDFTLSGQYLGTVSGDFIKVADKLKETSYLIRKRGGYSYPIFPVSKVPLAVGALLIEKGETDNQWHYYAAYLDILVQSGLVAKEKANAFHSTYKNPDEFCCLLAVDTNFVKFVYIPYPED
jgi:hypothetical protein